VLKLRWLIILISVALISGLAGLTAGVLLIPSSGDETRRQLSGFFEQHAYIIESLEHSQQALADAFEYVRVRVVPETDAS
jgi:gas vesicle protein